MRLQLDMWLVATKAYVDLLVSQVHTAAYSVDIGIAKRLMITHMPASTISK